jgi:hypothetical protein
MLFVGMIFSCKEEVFLKAIPTRQFCIEYKKDSIIVTEKKQSRLFRHFFVLNEGEYYNVDNGKMKLSFSVKRDTLIHESDSFKLHETETYIGRKEKSPYYRREGDSFPNGKYVCECYFIDADVKDGIHLQRAYYYDENYKIVGIMEYGYNEYH